MSVQLKNMETLTCYIERLIKDVVYQGGRVDAFTAPELQDTNFVTARKDRIIKAMIALWIRDKVRDYLIGQEDAPFLKRLIRAEDGDEAWVKAKIKSGEAVYFFDATKVPARFRADLEEIGRYLHSYGTEQLDELLRKNRPVRLSLLKENHGHETFALALNAAKEREREEKEGREGEKKRQKKRQGASHGLMARAGQFMANLGKRIPMLAKGKEKQDKEVIMTFKDGFKVLRLLTPAALDEEARYMGHCVGQSFYDKCVEDGSVLIYSLRDRKGEPHATIEVRDGKVIQCKGKSNRLLVSKYCPYVQDFVKEQKLDPSGDVQGMGLCKDINGNLHSIYNIPEGTVFENLDVSGVDFTELPASLAKCTVLGCFDCHDCAKLTSIKNLPKGIKKLDCHNCKCLLSLEGCHKDVEVVNCFECFGLKYIPEYISDDAIEYMSQEKITECKANWRAKQAAEQAAEQAPEQGVEQGAKADNLSRLIPDEREHSR